MPYRRVVFAPDQYYHVYNRGIDRQLIFREPENYVFLLRRIREYANRLDVAIIAYCLMPNHYHLLLRQSGEQPAGLLPQRVLNSYTKAFNRRYGRRGTLFVGPYQAIHVDREGYLLHLCRYIHANPIRHGLVNEIGAWPYSNYHEWVGTKRGALTEQGFMQDHHLTTVSYERFVGDYVAGRDRLPEAISAYLID